jgi:hypothetical protein
MNATTDATLAPGVHRGIPAEHYFGIKAVSASLLKTFILQTPAHAKAMLDGRMDEDTSAMNKGTALHAALLEPDMFAQQYIIGPEARRDSKEWKSFVAANPGREVLKPSENEDIVGMRESIWADDYCAEAIRACDERELTIIWNDAETGLLCKSRVDLYSTKRRMLLDVKTTGSIERFGKTVFDQGYDIQVSFYARAVQEGFGCVPKAAGFLVVEQGVPYLPEVFQPRPETLVGAVVLIEKAMAAIAECMSTGVWPGYRTNKSKARMLDVPAYRRVTTFDRGDDHE